MLKTPLNCPKSPLGRVVNLRVNFLSEIVRKTAYILGTICVVMSLLGAFLKLNSLPGGGISLILFTSLFSIAAMPLFLYSLSKAETEKAMQFAIRLCGFSFAVLQVGLLFCAQRWPEPMKFIYAGLAGQIVFVIVFLVNVRKPSVKTKSFSIFTVLAVLILLALVGGCYDRSKDSEIEAAQYAALDQVRSDLAIALNHSYELLQDTGSDTLFGNDSANVALLSTAADLVDYIQDIKNEIVSNSNYGVSASLDEKNNIRYPLDHDTPTFFMVGSDPANPTGKGLELYDQLLKFKTNILPAGVYFAVPVQDDAEMQTQWVKDNFYHATVLESLTRLTKIQIEICTSVNTSVEKTTNNQQ